MYRNVFAYAAAALLGLGLLLLPDGATAKSAGGGFMGSGFKGGVFPGTTMRGGHKFGPKHGNKFGHKFGKKHGHRHAGRHGRHRHGGFLPWGYAAGLETILIDENGQSAKPPAPPPQPFAEWKIYLVGTDGGCRSERVPVAPANGSGEVNIIRC